VRQRAITLTFTVGAPSMNSPKGEPWTFTDSRFLCLPPHHCFSVPVLKQVQFHSITLGSGGGHNRMPVQDMALIVDFDQKEIRASYSLHPLPVASCSLSAPIPKMASQGQCTD
jgi:hypothetical protein